MEVTIYTGIRYANFSSQEDLLKLYSGEINLGMLTNEYLIAKDDQGNVMEKMRWNGEKFESLKFKSVTSKFFGRNRAANDEQECALDLLQNDQIIGKLLVGGFGTGKTVLSLWWALSEVEKGKTFESLIYMRNNYETANTIPLGALPNGIEDKLFPFAYPLIDILGSEEAYQEYLQSGKIQLAHVGYLRGRTFKKTILYITEGQNLTKELLALIIARVGEGSVLVVEGDLRQCDKDIFRKNSGIAAMAEKFKGNPMFGMVTLTKMERSKFAGLSNLLLDE